MIINLKTPLANKAFGCIFGAFLGDSVGSLLEFQSVVSQKVIDLALNMPGGGVFRLSPGQLTDDSEMAMCLAKGLCEGGNEFDIDQIAK